MKTQASQIREKGEKGIQIVNSIKRYVNKILPENVKAQTSFNGKRFRKCFKIKDRTKFENQHNITMSGEKWSAENCPDNYVG